MTAAFDLIILCGMRLLMTLEYNFRHSTLLKLCLFLEVPKFQQCNVHKCFVLILCKRGLIFTWDKFCLLL